MRFGLNIVFSSLSKLKCIVSRGEHEKTGFDRSISVHDMHHFE